MKALVAALVAALLLAGCGRSPELGLAGVEVGAATDQMRQELAKRKDWKCEPRSCSGKTTLGAFEADMVIGIGDDGRVNAVALRADARQGDQLRAAAIEKFGQPQETGTRNDSWIGIPYQSQTAVWRVHGGGVRWLSRCGDSSYTCLMAFSPEVEARTKPKI